MTRPWHSSPWLWAGLLLAALAVRLGAAAWWQGRLPEGARFAFGDSESYWQLGLKLARGQPYEYGDGGWKIFRTPGYPLLLAGLFRVLPGGEQGPSVIAARVLGAVLGCLTIGGVAAIAWQLFGAKAAFLAAAITSIYPEAIAASIFILSEAPFGPPMTVHILAWILAWKATSPGGQLGWGALAGIAAGLGTLVRPSWLLFVPFALIVGLATVSDRRRQFVIGLVMLATMAATMSPWWIRNYQVAGRFVPTSLQVGTSLYDGLHPGASGASEMSFVPRFGQEQAGADAEARAAGQEPSGLFEDRLDQRMRAASIAWAKQNSGRVLELAGIKFLRMWSPVPNAGEFRSMALRLVLAISYTPVLLLGLIGLWRFGRRGWPYLLCSLLAVYFTLLHVIFVSSIRYRQPAMLLIIVLAAGLLNEWINTTRNTKHETPEP
ncbi:MAG TPA: glycosyltransferase family 39 protein [Pirellulaceae bacterium]|nr:glycosyltransferase family 39 protein [Pirellulaceae bacterium]